MKPQTLGEFVEFTDGFNEAAEFHIRYIDGRPTQTAKLADSVIAVRFVKPLQLPPAYYFRAFEFLAADDVWGTHNPIDVDKLRELPLDHIGRI